MALVAIIDGCGSERAAENNDIRPGKVSEGLRRSAINRTRCQAGANAKHGWTLISGETSADFCAGPPMCSAVPTSLQVDDGNKLRYFRRRARLVADVSPIFFYSQGVVFPFWHRPRGTARLSLGKGCAKGTSRKAVHCDQNSTTKRCTSRWRRIRSRVGGGELEARPSALTFQTAALSSRADHVRAELGHEAERRSSIETADRVWKRWRRRNRD